MIWIGDSEYWGRKDRRVTFNKFQDFFVQAFKIVVDSW